MAESESEDFGGEFVPVDGGEVAQLASGDDLEHMLGAIDSIGSFDVSERVAII